MKRLLISVIVLLGCSSPSPAPSTDLLVAWVREEGGASLEEAIEASALAEMYLRDFDVSISLAEVDRDPCEFTDEFEGWRVRANCYESQPFDGWIVGPIIIGGRPYIGGVASDSCGGKFYIATKTLRLHDTAFTLGHEIAHTLGAFHNDTEPNLMHTNGLAYLNPKLLPETIEEIQTCIH